LLGWGRERRRPNEKLREREVLMTIKLVVAVTDDEWFELLRGRPNLSEVNFWTPSAVKFRALRPGEMFLFKLHSPRNFIVGGGIFAYANALPCSLAWEAFGESNGARSAQEMRTRIARCERWSGTNTVALEAYCLIIAADATRRRMWHGTNQGGVGIGGAVE